MVAFDKNRYESHEAAVKYILTAVFSSGVFMMGLSFVYALGGSLYFDKLYVALSAGQHSTPRLCPSISGPPTSTRVLPLR